MKAAGTAEGRGRREAAAATGGVASGVCESTRAQLHRVELHCATIARFERHSSVLPRASTTLLPIAEAAAARRFGRSAASSVSVSLRLHSRPPPLSAAASSGPAAPAVASAQWCARMLHSPSWSERVRWKGDQRGNTRRRTDSPGSPDPLHPRACRAQREIQGHSYHAASTHQHASHQAEIHLKTEHLNTTDAAALCWFERCESACDHT